MKQYFMRIQSTGLALGLAMLISGCDFGAEPRSPIAEQLPVRADMNVLIVSFDALRADALGLYGYHRDTSPNLDAFAQQALVFEHAYSAAPVTPTSFASAFTGQLSFRVFHSWSLLETTTLAGVYSSAGFNTFAVLNNAQLVAERHFDQGWQSYQVLNDPDETVLETGLAEIERMGDQRFMGWIHFISPHTPYDPRPMSEHFYDPSYSGPIQSAAGELTHVENDDDLKRVRDLYDGEIFFADHLFQRLIDRLTQLGLMDNTLIVVTADHGEEFYDHGKLQHNSQYEEVIRIPMLIRHPDVARGSRTDAPYLNADLLPTLAAISGIAIEEVPDGIDLTRPWRPDRLRVSVGMTGRLLRQVSGTRENDKLIVTCKPDYAEEMYDLGQDPGEQSNRILDDPELAGRLYADIERIAFMDPCDAIQRAASGVAPETGLTEEQIQQLKSLGYLQ
jgi:arylsulfatase